MKTGKSDNTFTVTDGTREIEFTLAYGGLEVAISRGFEGCAKRELLEFQLTPHAITAMMNFLNKKFPSKRKQ